MTNRNRRNRSRVSKNRVHKFRQAVLSSLLAVAVLASGSLALMCGAAGASADTSAYATASTAVGGVNDSSITGSGGKISLDVRDADIRDLMSALSLKMGVNIVLLEDKAAKVSLQLDNTSPRQVLELLMQSQGLAYLQEGDIIVVGSPAKLHKDFFNQMHVTRFDTYFIPAEELKRLISQMGLSLKGVTSDANPNVLWVQGTVQDLRKVRELIQAVDSVDAQATLNHKTITLTHISPDRALELMMMAGVLPERFVMLDNRIMVFDRKLFNRWDEVQAMMQSIDTPSAVRQKVFVYQLKNTVAGDAGQRLEDLGFAGVKTSAYNYDRFGKELMVACPPQLENDVRSALFNIDQARFKTRVPVMTENGDNARNKLDAHRQLLSQLSGVPVSSMYLSNNLSGTAKEPLYVLWVEESPDKVQLIKDLIEELDTGSSGSSDE
ncbi:MAG TPA: energy transducer TonB [Desulfotomaculum sp.]|nr:MAG: hypothetical protein JL56_17125 [Desulfotomaculum sp. BICA1-6]HBX22293.1 energy transducer TonB [Desulfotomaculum sp.]